MPKPKPGESRDSFMRRCVPMVVEEGHEQDEAVARCMSIFRRGKELDDSSHDGLSVIERKTFDTDVKVADEETRIVTARISTIDVDRDGEVLLPSGVDLVDFRKNPVVLFGHSARGGLLAGSATPLSLPVGRAMKVEQTPRAIVATMKFAERPIEHPPTVEWVPDTILALFKQKVLNAFSVGFMVDEDREATDKDRARFGDGVRRVVSKWRLLEFSVVAVPANPNALATAVAKGFCPKTGWTAGALGVDTAELEAVGSEADRPRLRLTMPMPLAFD